MVLIVFAHPYPDRSRANRILLDAVRALPGVEVRSLYDLYPDFSVDVQEEQAVLSRASVIVLQHPMYWYHMHPLMKMWLDEVLSFGWAYGPGRSALDGKYLWLVTSSGATADSYSPAGYNLYRFEAFLPA